MGAIVVPEQPRGELQTGDVVVLKSGGPRMTIMDVTYANAFCAWFVTTELKSETFPLEALERPA